MTLIHSKTFKVLSEDTKKKLSEVGFNVSPGSIAKLFADIINKNISAFYERLSITHIQSFLTTSSGVYLDHIGKLVNCIRLEGESDDDFKKRINHQTLSLSKANEVAIRLAILSLENVEDVKIKRYSNGPGSMTIVPICKDTFNKSTLEAVKDVASNECSCGEKVIVKGPDLKYVKVDITLVMSSTIDDTTRQETIMNVRNSIEEYINSIHIGQTLIINKLTDVIMKTSDKIINYSCNNFKINNEPCLLINQGCRWDEKFVVSPDKGSILVR